MYYEGRFRTQYDGGDLEDENCTPTSVAMAINQVTDGQISLTGSQLRALVDKDEETAPDIKGWSLPDADLALKRLQAKHPQITIGIHKPGTMKFSRVKALRATGRGIILQGSKLKRGCPAAFFGDHCIYLPPLDHSDGRWRIGDPVCGEWTWQTEENIAMFAANFAGMGKARFRYTNVIPLAMPAQSFSWKADAKLGTVKLKGPGLYLDLGNSSLHPIKPPFQKRALGPIKLLRPFHGVTTAIDRQTGFLIHDDAAFILAHDVTFTPDG